jgi:hypothetical protein
MRIFALICLSFAITAFAAAQEQGIVPSRGSIPEELLRPKRGEALRYPIDTVIGELGQGRASAEAYSFARSIAAGLLSGEMGNSALAGINSVVREGYLSALEIIRPASYRLGGGREEPDGAVSFMIRYIGREQGITGELYVRYVTRQTEKVIKVEDDKAEKDSEDGDEEGEEAEEVKVEIITSGSWMFDDLILEEAQSREAEQSENLQRFDFSPYERFF